MSIKSPFLKGIQEEMRMRGTALEQKKPTYIGLRHSLTFTTSVTLRQWERKRLHNF